MTVRTQKKVWRFNEDGCGVWGVGRIDFFFILILKKVRLGCSGTDAGQTLYVDFGGDGVDEDG